MIDDSQDLESMARMLRQEREQLIVAWEQLEAEQRQLALNGSSPGAAKRAARQEETEPPQVQEPTPPTAVASAATPPPAPPRENAVLPSPSTIVRTVSAARKPTSSNTFRFLQREFDKPDEKRSP